VALKQYLVRLPPLMEQRRIIEKIEALLARVNAARERLAHVPAILKRFRQSVLAAASSGRLTEDWRESQTEDESASDLLAQIKTERETANAGARQRAVADDMAWIPEESRELPSHWSWIRVNEVLHYRRSAAYGVLQPGSEMANGIPMVRVCDV